VINSLAYCEARQVMAHLVLGGVTAVSRPSQNGETSMYRDPRADTPRSPLAQLGGDGLMIPVDAIVEGPLDLSAHEVPVDGWPKKTTGLMHWAPTRCCGALLLTGRP
jgi:hypothetical protein